MFYKSLMISGLRKQNQLLKDLLNHLESKPNFEIEDCLFYDSRTHLVANNLKRLRAIKEHYRKFLISSEIVPDKR